MASSKYKITDGTPMTNPIMNGVSGDEASTAPNAIRRVESSEPDPGGAWEDMASRNPGNPGFGAWANFSRSAWIGPSDTSIDSTQRAKQNEPLFSPISAERGKIWLPEILEILDLARGPTFHAPLGSGRPDLGGAWEDMASRNPGNPGFGAWANFSRSARIGPSDTSIDSTQRAKQNEPLLSPIPAERRKF
ncbi:hypothetical protein DdX_15170 [Ditylenchus destructor]|uniref:Uncharacterized protein n=1 Tax=Ditylenchus destructor TaxID=166010 RepID=A0AAD4MPZ3_9BILA|nr:hypothetical protein DdX_15170 [Ditylenchus destructor]